MIDLLMQDHKNLSPSLPVEEVIEIRLLKWLLVLKIIRSILKQKLRHQSMVFYQRSKSRATN